MVRYTGRSHLMNGHFSRFTTDKLTGFLIGLKKNIEQKPHKRADPDRKLALFVNRQPMQSVFSPLAELDLEEISDCIHSRDNP